MNVGELSEEPLVFSPNDSVSRVASSMASSGRRGAVLLKEGVFCGVVHAASLVKKRINEPDRTKIRGFAENVGVMVPGTTVEEAVNTFLINDYNSLPVEVFDKGKRILLLSKLSLLKGVRNSEVLKCKRAEDIMNAPYSVSPEDAVSTARAILRDMNISNVVVVSENRAVGIVGVLDLLVPMTRGETGKRGSMLYDRDSFEAVDVASFTRKDVARVSPDTPLTRVVDMMIKQQSPAVVERDGRMAGMIAPTDILKLVGKERKGIYVNITGMQEEDAFLKSVVDEEISNSMSKLAKILPLQWLAVHVDRHFEQGRRRKYSVRCRLITGKGLFVADSKEWDLTKAFKQALSRLEREAIRRKERKQI